MNEPAVGKQGAVLLHEGGEGGETAEEAGSKQAVSHRERFSAAFHGSLQQAHEKTAEHVDAEDAEREGHGQVRS